METQDIKTAVTSEPGTSGESKSWLNSRRNFLRVASAISSTSLVGGLFGCGGGTDSAADGETTRTAAQLLEEGEFWEQMRTLFEGADPAGVMNVDIGALAPKVSVQALLSGTRMRALAANTSTFTELYEQRQTIASGYGARPDELGLTRGATSGMWAAITGIPWKKGDGVICTDHEHPTVLLALDAISRTCGVSFSQVALPPAAKITPEGIVAIFEEEIARQRRAGINARALLWSSPTYQTGVMLPTARLVSLARRHGLLTICDAAHMVGMAKVDFNALGVDFLAASGHKWQVGPGQTGMLFVRRQSLGTEMADWRAPFGNSLRSRLDTGVDLGAEISRTVYSETNKFDGLAASSSLWDSIGRSRIEVYLLAQGLYLKRQIARKWGSDSLLSSDKSELLSAITAFDPFVGTAHSGRDASYFDFVQRTQANYGFTLRRVRLPAGSDGKMRPALRISTPLWIGSPDIDRLVSAMEELTRSMVQTSPVA